MEPPSALPRGGRVPWQDLLLAVSLLTLWNPLTIAQVTVEPVPPSATEGKDVLLQVHNLPGDTRLDVRVIIPGPAHSGRETVYPNGSLLFRNITLKDTGYYTLQIVDRNYELTWDSFPSVSSSSDEGSTTGFPVGSMVGITVGVLVGLALVATLGCLLLRTRTGRYDDISHTLILFCSCPQPGGRLCPDLEFWTGSSRLPAAPWIFLPIPSGSFLELRHPDTNTYCQINHKAEMAS
uniref:Immunoglobulin subtype domain-containing protein n=1 Tax=Neovison vison TaxID=452646 RepID=A0A8C7C6W9_NEOVI